MSLGLLILLFPAVSHAATVLVDTQYGPVRGHCVSCRTRGAKVDVTAFLGIPFGKSTAGEMRFRVGACFRVPALYHDFLKYLILRKGKVKDY